MKHTSKKTRTHAQPPPSVLTTPPPTPAEALAQAAATYDATCTSPAQQLTEVSDTLTAQDGAILRAIGLLRCSSLNVDIDPALVDAAIEILADVRETIRVCVHEELRSAGVFAADNKAVTS
jgi:hypothetical protein